MNSSKTLLVTGATGVLGSALIEQLLCEGHSVIGIGRKKYGLLSDSIVNGNNFVFIQNDLIDFDVNVLMSYQIDGIIHLANRGFVDGRGNNNKGIGHDEIFNVNVRSTRKLIELAKLQEIKFLIFASSVSVFGKQSADSVISELTYPTPLDYYGLTKYYAERLIEIELAETAAKGIVLRFPLIFSKDHLGGLVYTFYKLAASNEPIVIFGKGNAYRCPIYINDAISIILKNIEHVDDLNSYEIFACGSSDSMRILDIAKEIICLTNSKSEIKFVDKPFSLDWDMKIDISKICKKLKFDPMSINEGLKLYINDLNN
jgi:nucleoside-diphosphate-sugar epimerase